MALGTFVFCLRCPVAAEAPQRPPGPSRAPYAWSPREEQELGVLAVAAAGGVTPKP